MKSTQGVDRRAQQQSDGIAIPQNVFPLERMPLLSEIPLDKTISEEDYKRAEAAARLRLERKLRRLAVRRFGDHCL
ncbi:MAG: hypothetical protein ACLTF6_10280 [Clostridium sp.]